MGNERHFPATLAVPSFERLLLAHHEDLVLASTPDLAQFERLKRIRLLPREFSIEAGEQTPTVQVKRRVIEQKYKDLIDNIYEGAAHA